MSIDLVRARKKLRQAEFFLAHLRHAAEDMALQMRRGRQPDEEQLEYWFSACLSAAQSVYFVLEKTGGKRFKQIQAAWRRSLGSRAGNEFGWMIGVRGVDVHLGVVPGSVMPKMVAAAPWEQQWVGQTEAVYGPAEIASFKNPDGTLVESSGVVGSRGLYIDTPSGERLEAESLCRRFINHLADLLKHVEKDVAQPSS
jgi:hypothetical protein